jgi:hypothetical protein
MKCPALMGYVKLQVTPFCLRCCTSSWPPGNSGWWRLPTSIDALLNVLTCVGPLMFDFSINQVKHDHTPDQESKPQRLHWQATWHAQQRRTDEQRLTTPWTKTPRHNRSGTVQVKFKTAKQQHVMILSCRGFSYGSAIFLDPLTATSLDHQHTLLSSR